MGRFPYRIYNVNILLILMAKQGELASPLESRHFPIAGKSFLQYSSHSGLRLEIPPHGCRDKESEQDNFRLYSYNIYRSEQESDN